MAGGLDHLQLALDGPELLERGDHVRLGAVEPLDLRERRRAKVGEGERR